MSRSKIMPNFKFRLLSAWITFRSIKRKPQKTLQELGIKEKQHVLDYGAGPGAFTIPAAKLVGISGTVIAVDIHPLSKKMIEHKAKRQNLWNIKALLANINTDLSNEVVDVILLFDVIHQIEEKGRLFKELHRLLKTGGKLFIRPDHMSNENLKAMIKSDGLFAFLRDHKEILEFQKIG